MTRLAGRRVLVVGASKGIGRVIARRLDTEGARVVVAARSKDLLDAVTTECANGAIPVQCDVRDPNACEALVAQAATALGGLDALVYSTGMYPFIELKDATADHWAAVLETNLVGAALITRAALPHLKAARGHAVYLSSNSASYSPPWRGIGLYITSKTALEKLVRCWEVENPDVAFTVHVVGPTTGEAPPTDIEASPGDATLYADLVGEWYAKGYVGTNLLPPETHAEALISVLTTPARIQTITVVPRP
jgi:NAD(P)-dependent dehydrogenase (short-subunit alcohol dehydrogenase family)